MRLHEHVMDRITIKRWELIAIVVTAATYGAAIGMIGGELTYTDVSRRAVNLAVEDALGDPGNLTWSYLLEARAQRLAEERDG